MGVQRFLLKPLVVEDLVDLLSETTIAGADGAPE